MVKRNSGQVRSRSDGAGSSEPGNVGRDLYGFPSLSPYRGVAPYPRTYTTSGSSTGHRHVRSSRSFETHQVRTGRIQLQVLFRRLRKKMVGSSERLPDSIRHLEETP